MTVSRIGRRGRTTIPRAIRDALRLRDGDTIAYAIDGERVTLRRVAVADETDTFVIFSEWDGDADRRAYRGL